MSNVRSTSPAVTDKTENPNVLRRAGGALFFLGLAAAVVAFVQQDIGSNLSLGLNAAGLLALGDPLLLYVQALQKIRALEHRLRQLEQRPER